MGWKASPAGSIEVSMFFSKEKAEPALREPKDFYFSVAPAIEAIGRDRCAASGIKVFCFFSSEKKDFS
jgi:hypothetical protein